MSKNCARWYNENILQPEQDSFTPLIFGTNGRPLGKKSGGKLTIIFYSD